MGNKFDIHVHGGTAKITVTYDVILQALGEEIRTTGRMDEAKLLDAIQKLRRSRFAKMLYPLT